MDCSRDGSEDIGRWDFWDRSNDVVVVAAFYNLLLLVGEMAVFPIYAVQQHRAHFRFVKAWTGGIWILNVFLSRMGEIALVAVVTFLLRSEVSTESCSIIGRGDFDKLL